jgi:hypothetical protein
MLPTRPFRISDLGFRISTHADKWAWNCRGGVYPLPAMNSPPAFHPGGDKPRPYERFGRLNIFLTFSLVHWRR